MSNSTSFLKKDEKYVFSLRKLYEQYGYKKYKMSNFEEYSLYLENKSFLKSDNIITFNDSSGRLLALRPDITLSIVKNAKDSASPNKLYYSENVYRAADSSSDIKEIMQVGLEYIGLVDTYATSEVITLAAKSLEAVSPDYVLCISHLAVVSSLLDRTGLSDTKKAELSHFIASKSSHGIRHICDIYNVSSEITEKLVRLSGTYGSFESILPIISEFDDSESSKNAISKLTELYTILKSTGCADKLRIDFSMMNDLNYYNGFIFQGFIDEVPTSVLYGGQYDNLLHKLGRKSDAIGFAVYLDVLERYNMAEKTYDVDVLLLYDESTDYAVLANTVNNIIRDGYSVRAQRYTDNNLKYRELARITDGRVEYVEENA